MPIGDTRPGLNSLRMVRLMRRAIERCELDLTGLTVLTEAASGCYTVTPVLSAMAGARTYALSAATAYASAQELGKITLELAYAAGVAGQITLIPEKDPAITGLADIVTNSGQVRPIGAAMIADMSPSCVIPLMYESWEFRPGDIDLAACRARGIRVAGTNERHPAVDVFSFLGQMAVKLLHDAGVSVYGSRITLLCDNHFRSHISAGLRGGGAELTEASVLSGDSLSTQCDAVVLARTPGSGHEFSAAEAQLMASRAPGAILAQFWGDTDRGALAMAGVPVWPERAPAEAHMGVLPSAIGPEPVIRLQAGGLKVGQILASGAGPASPDDQAFIQVLQ